MSAALIPAVTVSVLLAGGVDVPPTTPVTAPVDEAPVTAVEVVDVTATNPADAAGRSDETGGAGSPDEAGSVADSVLDTVAGSGDAIVAPAVEPVPGDAVPTDTASAEAVPADTASAEAVPADTASAEAAPDALPELAQPVDRAAYPHDGVDRPFWWEADGLHFAEPIPPHGYVNINVPGASNLSIDTNRDLIGQTFIPWDRFGLQPGMCVAWTESNGYGYHFGEDNSGRGGVDERGWVVCVPEPVPGPDPEPEPEPEPDPTPDPGPDVPDVPDVPANPADPVVPGDALQPAEPVDTAGVTATPAVTSAAPAPADATATRAAARTALAVTGAPAAVLGAAAAAALAAGTGLVTAAARRRRCR